MMKSFGALVNAYCQQTICLAAVLIVTLSHSKLLAFHDPATDMLKATQLMMASLTEEQATKIQFSFDNELRKDWQFIPMDRKGLGLKELKPHQRHLAMSVLQSALSHRGFSTSMQIMALEQVLHEMENNAPHRDPSKYHFFIFGKPSGDSTWALRIEGHHLSISFTIVEGKTVVTTPAFFGANPGEVRQGKLEGLRALGDEEDLGRKLIKTLSATQKETAIIAAKAPRDVILGPGKEATPLKPMGMPASEMSDEQKQTLRQLIAVYLGKFRPEIADRDMKKIDENGFDKIHFAWAGQIQPKKPHYYRVQGPTFVLEYDNTQNKANHIHAVWRDFENDFGAGLLKQHYQTVPHSDN